MRSLSSQGIPFVVVTVIETLGSAPREVGARIVVTENETFDSIGGGKLEYEAARRAQEILEWPSDKLRTSEMLGLGITMSQCCGGAVRLLFEKYEGERLGQLHRELVETRRRQFAILVSPVSNDGRTFILNLKREPEDLPDFLSVAAERLLEKAEPRCNLVEYGGEQWFLTRLDEQPTRLILFGAGHVGKALVKILEDLPFRIEWVDERPEVFPDIVPANTNVHRLPNPLQILDVQDDGTFYVVMTHSHGRDYEICLEILQKHNFGWLGLIGSETKRKRFIKRFLDDGLDAFILRRLECPIGIDKIKGKLPSVIALSTAAQLLEQRQQSLQKSAVMQSAQGDAPVSSVAS